MNGLTLIMATMDDTVFTARDLAYLCGLVATVTSIIISNRSATKASDKRIGELSKSTDKKLDELTKKQDKYNNLQWRMAKIESSTASAHHRIDDNERRINERLDKQGDDIKEVNGQLLTKLDKLIEQNNEHVEKYHMKG